jgi:transcriptional regulator with XRE-family HTH domain
MSQPQDEQQPPIGDQRPPREDQPTRIGERRPPLEDQPTRSGERRPPREDQPTRSGDRRPPREDRRPRPLLRTMLGEVLRRTRLDQGRTLADVARAARVSMPYLSEVERGRKEASSEVLAAICDALRIDITDLLAATGRDLITQDRQRAAIIRLADARSTRLPNHPHRSGDAICQLAA